jgi:hypothetical protein
MRFVAIVRGDKIARPLAEHRHVSAKIRVVNPFDHCRLYASLA